MNPPAKRYDLLVIGSGPAGQKAALQAARLGKQAAIVERKAVVGGACVNTGTIPSKTLREAVLHISNYRQRGGGGQDPRGGPDVSFAELAGRAGRVIASEIENIRAELKRNRVELIPGTARFVSPQQIEVESSGGEILSLFADSFVIAVGARARRPVHVSFDSKRVVDSAGVLHLEAPPRTLTVVGAGVIGVEYASIFGALGVEVQVVERRPGLLDFVDQEIADELLYQLQDSGVTFRFGEEVGEICTEQNQVRAVLRSGKQLVSDALLYAAGRQGATAGLGLERIGVSPDDDGRLRVNHRYQTNLPHIFAVGDVIGFPSLASTSMEQGRIAACHAFGAEVHAMPELFPYGIYTIPEISMVGATEAELTAAQIPYEVGVARYGDIARGPMGADDRGLIKLIVHRGSHRLLGVHAIGTSATEIIHVGQAVLAFEGGLDYFVSAVFNYPTYTECYKMAAFDALRKLEEEP